MMANNQVIWVTGASSGIGEAIVHHYAQHYHGSGMTIIASARSEQVLENQFKQYQSVYSLPVDVTSDSSMANAEAIITKKFGYLTHLYVNAGQCEYVDELPMNINSLEKLLAVNVKGAANTINAALPLLEKSPVKGLIIGIASQVIFAPFIRAEFYGASKAAFDYLLRSLRLDLIAKGIDVSIVYPGFVKTPLTDKNDFPMPFLQTAEKAASIIVKGINQRKQRIIFPRRLYFFLKLSGYFPGLWQRLLLDNNQQDI